jgi:predicted transcriptional regulator
MLLLSIDEPDELIRAAHALSSEVRVNMIRLLNDERLNIVEMSEKLSLPVSTVAANVKVLEQAGLIITEVQPASRGVMKVCKRNFEAIRMTLNPSRDYANPNKCYQMEMPVGHYTDCKVSPTCGLISTKGVIEPQDEPSIFYHPNRMGAQLIWFRKGYVAYKFPVVLPQYTKIASIQFSLELCSEAPRFDHNWPSDITMWINNHEIGTWTCPGDFGERRGKLNPSWLPDDMTQYGMLKTWKVDASGSYLDEMRVSDTTLEQLGLQSRECVVLKIGIKPNAANIGGMNLFGREFGDYDQDIMMRILYK